MSWRAWNDAHADLSPGGGRAFLDASPGSARSNGGAFALKLTAAGMKAITAAGDDRAVANAAVESATVEKTASVDPPREGSKLDRVLAMLSATSGATIAELIAATHWLPHTTRAVLTGLRKRGYELTLTRGERDGVSVYRIAGP
jgi:uncharacterized protein DUF3489